MALPQEVQTRLIITQALQAQKCVTVPVIRGQELIAVALSEAATRLRRGRFGILEPCAPQRIIHPQEFGCIAIPGIAFDARGRRLDGFFYGMAHGILDSPARKPRDLGLETVLMRKEMILQNVPVEVRH